MLYIKHFLNHILNLFILVKIFYDHYQASYDDACKTACSRLRGKYDYCHRVENFTFTSLLESWAPIVAMDIAKKVTGKTKMNFDKILLRRSIKNGHFNEARYYAALVDETFTQRDLDEMLHLMVRRKFFCEPDTAAVKELLKMGAIPPSHEELAQIMGRMLRDGCKSAVDNIISALGIEGDSTFFSEKDLRVFELAQLAHI